MVRYRIIALHSELLRKERRTGPPASRNGSSPAWPERRLLPSRKISTRLPPRTGERRCAGADPRARLSSSLGQRLGQPHRVPSTGTRAEASSWTWDGKQGGSEEAQYPSRWTVYAKSKASPGAGSHLSVNRMLASQQGRSALIELIPRRSLASEVMALVQETFQRRFLSGTQNPSLLRQPIHASDCST